MKKNYVVYILETGQIKYFWSVPPTPTAPAGMAIIEVGDTVSGDCVDTYMVSEEQLVLIE